jgi:hypothetical protein
VGFPRARETENVAGQVFFESLPTFSPPLYPLDLAELRKERTIGLVCNSLRFLTESRVERCIPENPMLSQTIPMDAGRGAPTAGSRGEARWHSGPRS